MDAVVETPQDNAPAGEVVDKPLHFRIGAELYGRVGRLAEREHRSISNLLRLMIIEGVERREKDLDTVQMDSVTSATS